MAGEILINSATKAMSELSETLFLPAMIIGLVVECPDFLIGKEGFRLLEVYLLYAITGFVASFSLLTLLGLINHKSHIQFFIAGSFIFPIGVASIFPNYFSSIQIPLQEPTGVCICIWGFYLIKLFFDDANKKVKEVR